MPWIVRMIVLLQRVIDAEVKIKKHYNKKIKKGALLYIGIEKQDNKNITDKMITKVLNYRVFNDSKGKINLNIKDINGDILVISSFSLVANTKNGTRAGFSVAATPEKANEIYEHFVSKIKSEYKKIESGMFAGDMKVTSTNDGPINFLLKV
jgi:D-aminoacyl-tRNA deacylase